MNNIPKTIFAIFCFIFTTFLLFVVVYETTVTKELPTDNDKKLEKISEKYSLIPKVIADMAIDEDEEYEDEKDKHDKGWYD